MKNRVLIVKEQFHVDEKNKTVVCTLNCNVQEYKHVDVSYMCGNMYEKSGVSFTGHFTVKAKARCNASDTFDEVVGKRIAESRAKAKAYKVAARFWKNSANVFKGVIASCEYAEKACLKALEVENKHVEELTK